MRWVKLFAYLLGAVALMFSGTSVFWSLWQGLDPTSKGYVAAYCVAYPLAALIFLFLTVRSVRERRVGWITSGLSATLGACSILGYGAILSPIFIILVNFSILLEQKKRRVLFVVNSLILMLGLTLVVKPFNWANTQEYSKEKLETIETLEPKIETLEPKIETLEPRVEEARFFLDEKAVNCSEFVVIEVGSILACPRLLETTLFGEAIQKELAKKTGKVYIMLTHQELLLALTEIEFLLLEYRRTTEKGFGEVLIDNIEYESNGDLY